MSETDPLLLGLTTTASSRHGWSGLAKVGTTVAVLSPLVVSAVLFGVMAPEMTTPESLLPGGAVFVFSGWDGSGPTDSTEVLGSLDAARWALSSRAPLPRANHAAARLGDSIFLVGGSDASGLALAGRYSVLRYSLNTGQWSPEADLLEPRVGPVAAACDDRWLLVAGGAPALDAAASADTAWLLPGRQWAPLAPLESPAVFGAVSRADGTVSVLGGATDAMGEGTTTVQTRPCSASANETWTAAPPLSSAVLGAAVAELDGFTYLLGGVGADGNPRASAYRRSSASGAWETLPRMPTARAFLGAAAHEGKVLAIGGEVAGGEVVGAVEVFDPKARSWRAGPPLRTNRSRFAAVAT